MPNQEKVTNRVNRVTYHDKTSNVRMILLPNRELLQGHFSLSMANSFWEFIKQERELVKIQSGTVLESG